MTSIICNKCIFYLGYELQFTDGMRIRKEIENLALDTERGKELDLDAQARPRLKVCHPYVPVPDSAEPNAHAE
jgi:hypothetical protein